MRTFDTQHAVKISPETFMALQLDDAFDSAMAALEDCVLNTPCSKADVVQGVPVVHKVANLELKNNPVPPLLRGVLGTTMDELISGKITLEHTVYPQQTGYAHAKETKTMLPGSLREVIQVESQQWIERLSDEEVLLLSRHMVSCSLFGIGGAVEAAIEQGIRDTYDKLPGQMEKWVAARTGAAVPAAGSPNSGAKKLLGDHPASVKSRQCDADFLACCAARRKPRAPRVSFVGDLCRDRALSGRELAIGRPRVISVTVERDNTDPSTPTRLAFAAHDALGDMRGRTRTVSVTCVDSKQYLQVDDSNDWMNARVLQCFGGLKEYLGYGPPTLLT